MLIVFAYAWHFIVLTRCLKNVCVAASKAQSIKLKQNESVNIICLCRGSLIAIIQRTRNHQTKTHY